MNKTDFVTDLEKSKRLKELGVRFPTEFYWSNFAGNSFLVKLTDPDNAESLQLIPAFLLSDLIEILGDKLQTLDREGAGWVANIDRESMGASSAIDAVANLLVHSLTPMPKYTVEITYTQKISIYAPSADVAILKAKDLASSGTAEIQDIKILSQMSA